MSWLEKTWYRATAWVPRRLPENDEAFYELIWVMTNVFDIPAEPDVRITIVGQVTSTQPNKMYRSYLSIANAAKRMNVNRVARKYNEIQMDILKERLAAAIDKTNKEFEKEDQEKELVATV